VAVRGVTVYERVDSWYSDDAKKSGGEARLIQPWIVISYSADPVAFGHPFTRSQINCTKDIP